MSKIEQIAINRLYDEFRKQKEILENNCLSSIEQLNATYDNLLETLHQLELTDATLFDFFEKCNGNIRIKTLDKTNWDEHVDLIISGTNVFGNNNNITLKKDKKYKIIFMAIEEDDNK